MIVDTIFARQFDEDAIDALSARGNQLIDELAMTRPILCTLFDGQGEELARFVLGSADPTDANCDCIEAELRSQSGASLRMIDANGVACEVLLIVGSAVTQ